MCSLGKHNTSCRQSARNWAEIFTLHVQIPQSQCHNFHLQIPKSAKLHFGMNKQTKQIAKYPLVNIRNVYMFPGVPQLLEKSFDMLQVSDGVY